MKTIDFEKPSRVHFIGIGGISMSGFAELLNSKGFTVSGSDRKCSQVTKHLEDVGISCRYGTSPDNIPSDCDCVIYTAAVSEDNPELMAAKARGIRCINRAELAGDVMLHYKRNFSIAGTHGKTTTTSMLSMILLAAGLDPTVSVGGIFDGIGGNMRNGGTDDFVIESCEYTDSFLHFHPTHAIITNIEAEHLDYFHDLETERLSFRKFADLLPADGLLVVNMDIPEYAKLFDNVKCPIVTYRLSVANNASGNASDACSVLSDNAASDNTADFTASDISFDEKGCGSYTLLHCGTELGQISLSVPGTHNISNSMAAAAMAVKCGIAFESIQTGLKNYGGTGRRFEIKGQIGGVTVVDDYAHHPTEMKATLLAAANYPHKKIWCVFQPHTYSRTISFRKEICDALALADNVVLADIYAAREADPGTISSAMLADDLRREKGTNAFYFPSFDEIENFLLKNVSTGDLLITMGAGDVVNIGEHLLGK